MTIAVLGAALLLLGPGAGAVRDAEVVAELRAPILRAGVRLVGAVQQPVGLPITVGLRLTTARQTHEIRSLNGMQDHVEIRNPSQALMFTRLTTTPTTYLLWSTTPEVEVVRLTSLAKLPTWSAGSKLTSVLGTGTPVGDGYLGVLKDDLFRELGLQDATARSVGQGFEVRRWLYSPASSAGDRPRLLLVEERVSPSGGYSRRIIKARQLPKRPGLDWRIDYRM